jgi:exodeoxyribonuclease VII small subunit
MTTKKKQSFEEALQRLELIVSELESGNIPLDKSLKTFEEGRELISQCLAILDDAEKKIKKLDRSESGDLQLSLL